MEEVSSAFKILTGTSAGKRPLGREENIRKVLEEIGINASNWVDFPRGIYILHSYKTDSVEWSNG